MSAVEAVLWDFGGVLTTSPFEAFNTYESRNGLPKDFIRSINARNPDSNAWAQFERSDISPEEFDYLFRQESQAAGHGVPGSDVIALLGGNLRPQMVEALKRCKRSFKVGCITNNVSQRKGGPGMGRDPTQTAAMEKVFELFDMVIESSKAGIRKPDPKIYQLACGELGVAPSRSVYLDDLGINLKPARALGMTTIKVSDPDRALVELEAATGLALRS